MCVDHDYRLECSKILGTVPSMEFYVYKVASGVTKLVVIATSFGEESQLYSHVFPFFPPYSFGQVIFLGTVTDWKLFFTHYAVIRGEKSRKGFATLLQRHRAAVTIQKHVKTEFARNRMKNTIDAAVVIQSCKNF